jgi:hypothetical protein
MKRVVEPLTRMGAHITMTEAGTAPLAIRGGMRLRGIDTPCRWQARRSNPASCWRDCTPAAGPASPSRRLPAITPNACWPAWGIPCSVKPGACVLKAGIDAGHLHRHTRGYFLGGLLPGGRGIAPVAIWC